MSEVQRYYVGKYGLVEGEALGRINVVLGADHDRVTAERNALQERLTATDQRLDEATALLQETSKVLRGGACYGWENNQADEIDTFLGFKVVADPAMPPDEILMVMPGDDIPDFTTGNGNRARRRAAAIEALKPENQRIVPCNTEQRPDYFKCLKVD